MRRTLDEIRRDGLTALRRELGRAGMIRFLQQFDHGEGDYAARRREWVDGISLDEIKRLAATPRRKRRPPGGASGKARRK